MQLSDGKGPRYPGLSRHPDRELTILPTPLALAILNTLALSSAVVCQEGQTLDPEARSDL